MMLLTINLINDIYCGLKEYYKSYSRKTSRHILEHVYLNLVRSRLGICEQVNDSDKIIRKAQRVVDIIIQTT